mmetsp:Transcript_67215/g.151979  ORF Transcript_67215/g.151979 Transcript_67215/m.151979 type:complete len:349 (-) Transcript_67215:530-1576(-)
MAAAGLAGVLGRLWASSNTASNAAWRASRRARASRVSKSWPWKLLTRPSEGRRATSTCPPFPFPMAPQLSAGGPPRPSPPSGSLPSSPPPGWCWAARSASTARETTSAVVWSRTLASKKATLCRATSTLVASMASSPASSALGRSRRIAAEGSAGPGACPPPVPRCGVFFCVFFFFVFFFLLACSSPRAPTPSPPSASVSSSGKSSGCQRRAAASWPSSGGQNSRPSYGPSGSGGGGCSCTSFIRFSDAIMESTAASKLMPNFCSKAARSSASRSKRSLGGSSFFLARSATAATGSSRNFSGRTRRTTPPWEGPKSKSALPSAWIFTMLAVSHGSVLPARSASAGPPT